MSEATDAERKKMEYVSASLFDPAPGSHAPIYSGEHPCGPAFRSREPLDVLH